MSLTITVRTPVRPTEDPEKVLRCVVRIFPGARVETVGDELVAAVDSLDRLRELVRSQQIPDSARGVMMGGLRWDGRSARFRLGKQAAFGGRAHFGALLHPLGELEVTLESDTDGEIEKLIYRIAPDTTVPPEWAEVPRSMRPDDFMFEPEA